MTTEEHKIKTSIWKRDGKWVIHISGVTSGVEINGGDGDNMSIEFKLDASRFHPVLTQEK